MYIYHALINTLSAHMIHINLNMIFYTHVELAFLIPSPHRPHSPWHLYLKLGPTTLVVITIVSRFGLAVRR